MCGICGIVGLEDKALVERMRDSMAHRGPDDKGVYVDDGVSLGHRRLSIIDLSSRGRQPMGGEDEGVQIVYNGETFNYLEVRRELEAEGHRFVSDSDTEVLVHGYEQWGPGFASRIGGQCAAAVWEGKEKTLLLVRDRLGIKPLYYAAVDGMLLFASEIKALFMYEGLKPGINYRALDNYLTFQYVPEPETIFEGILKVLPGRMVTYKNGRITSDTYWDLGLKAGLQTKTSAQVAVELKARLEEAVKSQLVSDVPLGVHLSGGIDSSAIASLMTGMVDEPLKTFSIGYGSEMQDELGHARIVSEYLGTDHHEIIAEPEEVVGELGKIVWHLDEPIGDPAIMPQYFLGKHTKKDVTVVFNGGGSDEIFAGYRAYSYLLQAERIRSLVPQRLRSLAASAARGANPPARVRRYIEYVGANDDEKTYWGQGLLFDGAERDALYSPALKERTAVNNPADMIRRHFKPEADSSCLLNRFLYVDIRGWLTDNCLMLIDKVMMAHAVECRVPFLDHKLVEYSMTIPPGMKTGGGVEKRVLRESMAGRLPESTLRRPKKGFGVPTDCWLFKDVNDTVTDRLSESGFIRDNFSRERVNFLLKGTRDFRHSSQLFGLLVLDIWHERYIGGRR